SLDPALVGADGYHELFQAGEVFDGRPLIDRQHPHDLFMQLAASWRFDVSSSTHLTLTGAPVGAPALGPIPYMHRASSFDDPMTPLTHHLFDSTHTSFGVATASLDHGPWTLQGSVFNGREPDQNRWDFDFGAMDSVSGRLWFKPTSEWAFQVSTGHLVSPEALVPGNFERTTRTASSHGGVDLCDGTESRVDHRRLRPERRHVVRPGAQRRFCRRRTPRRAVLHLRTHRSASARSRHRRRDDCSVYGRWRSGYPQ